MGKQDEIPTIRDAEEAWAGGDPETALAIAEGLIGEDESQAPAEVLYLAAECLLDLQEPGEALHLLDALVERESDDGVLRHSRGVARFELGRLDEAAEDFAAAVRAEPELGEARFYLGALAERRGDFEAAQRHYAEAVSRDPENLAEPRNWSEAEVGAALSDVLSELPELVSSWLASLPTDILPLPSDEQLVTDDGPVSPLVHCLFVGGERGAPAGDDPAEWLLDKPERLAIFRLNLGKSALDEDELRGELLEALLWETIEFLGLEDDHLAALDLLED